jgi:GT2 family glycosyltransferase
VPVYNGERDLPGCLASIRAALDALPGNERTSIEVIVCDNWSSDASFEIAGQAGLPCRYRVMRPERHEPNRTRNWRAGFAEASADWMMMLHADDLLGPRGFAALLRAVARPEAKRAAIITGRHRTFEQPDRPSGLHPRWTTTSLISGKTIGRTVLALHCPFVPFVLMRRAAYEAVGGLDERWELVQDWVLWMRLARVGDVLFVPEEIGWWRLHATSPKYREINAREHVALAAELPDHVGPLPREWHARARQVARARAAVQLEGVDADPSPWLGSDRLPPVATANAVLARTYRVVSALQLMLRATGVVRRVARQH